MTAPVLVGPLPAGGGPTPFPDWDDVLADIGDRIRAERQARGWSQTELGRRAGMGLATVKRLENGETSLRGFVRACRALGVPADHLLSDQWQIPLPRPSLTARQAEVLAAVSDGRPLSEAARDLHMTPEGLASELSGRIYQRLGVSDAPRLERRAAAVRVAVEYGLITLPNRTS
ncbi:helix-turn-helix domain-containing protein [Streptomyces chartreusis]|uniref:helix-turn-helix domain-containing protein n=1 Tax=Streptomyces chartreusis TaxID=1969 RepID=UPI00364F23E3